jgi:quinol monooxygenase YgiN
MVGLEIQIQLLKGKRREFIQAFEFLTRKTAAECFGQYLYEDVGNDDRFLWIERWSVLNALEDHLRSDRFKSILGAIEILGEMEDLQIIEYKTPSENIH